MLLLLLMLTGWPIRGPLFVHAKPVCKSSACQKFASTLCTYPVACGYFKVWWGKAVQETLALHDALDCYWCQHLVTVRK